jgi:predicted AAA+ superfamily ATPase
MLLTVKDACELHPMTLEYSMSEQVENLSDVVAADTATARAFFDKNYVTKGMETLLNQGLRRLGGKSDQAVFELKQAMGGGKTHSMIALGLLARDPALGAEIVPEIARDAAFGDARLVAVEGRSGFEERFVWGEIASQLGKGAQFSKFWRDGAKAPAEKDWIDLIGDDPTLILLDELPPYFDYAVTRLVGNGNLAQVTTYALSNLLSASLKLKRCCIVVSNLSGSYEGASKQLRQAIRDFEQEANRQARAVTPVELASQEIYEILRKRLFRKLPDKSVIDSVATAYAAALSEAVRSKSVAKSAEQIAEDVHGSYPFHPSVKHIVALFKENDSYRQTRGLMQFVSKMIKSAWVNPVNNVYLIGCQHLNLNLMDVREEVNKISNLQGAIAHDIASGGAAVAETVDGHNKNDAASQCAALLLTGSLSESVDAVKGFAKPQMLEYLIAPNRTAIEFQDAFEALKAGA